MPKTKRKLDTAEKPVFKWNWTITTENGLKTGYSGYSLISELSTWLDISVEPPCVTIENYHDSKELKLVQNLQKHVFFTLPNLPLSSPDTDSEDPLNITETPY